MTNRRKCLAMRCVVGWHATIICLLLLGSAMSAASVAQASTCEVHVKDGRVELIAHQARLIDILRELSRKADFHLLAEDPLEELVSTRIHAATVEDCIRKLISKKSHAMYYKRLSDSEVALASLKIVGSGQSGRHTPQGATPDAAEEQLYFDPDWYAKAMSDTAALSKQFKARKVLLPANMHPTGKGGIQVMEVAQDSFFSKIGIAKGDIIKTVNDTEVSSSQAFFQAMRWSQGSPTAVRIERLDADDQLDPIYIYIERH